LYEPVTFTDYHEMIMYIRKNSLGQHPIYETIANSWNESDSSKRIDNRAYTDSYNGFVHFKDKNYEEVY
jgi:hypothetical protein